MKKTEKIIPMPVQPKRNYLTFSAGKRLRKCEDNGQYGWWYAQRGIWNQIGATFALPDGITDENVQSWRIINRGIKIGWIIEI